MALRRSISSIFSKIDEQTAAMMLLASLTIPASLVVCEYWIIRKVPDDSRCKSKSRALEACLKKNDNDAMMCKSDLHVFRECMVRYGGF